MDEVDQDTDNVDETSFFPPPDMTHTDFVSLSIRRHSLMSEGGIDGTHMDTSGLVDSAISTPCSSDYLHDGLSESTSPDTAYEGPSAVYSDHPTLNVTAIAQGDGMSGTATTKSTLRKLLPRSDLESSSENTNIGPIQVELPRVKSDDCKEESLARPVRKTDKIKTRVWSQAQRDKRGEWRRKAEATLSQLQTYRSQKQAELETLRSKTRYNIGQKVFQESSAPISHDPKAVASCLDKIADTISLLNEEWSHRTSSKDRKISREAAESELRSSNTMQPGPEKRRIRNRLQAALSRYGRDDKELEVLRKIDTVQRESESLDLQLEEFVS
ncbi:hypothetical protein I302_102906 [Kwoniella bestiolae CBS 10118]|uniref:Uncharacterized protein n=1 Tax=Kwoniella bestiolae CBS 10118 TaxID=1296100 RepID=A0A1B9GGA3_9TREE|nr:hypothetical protein I302_01602 [Kwoniella bestiolae CBS 10118]OCF30083.1 hypothetical protein I302_01602 [Kwoniella bestiolae CBS 10118]